MLKLRAGYCFQLQFRLEPVVILTVMLLMPHLQRELWIFLWGFST